MRPTCMRRAKMGRFVSQHGTAAVVTKFIGELGCSKNAKLKCREFSKLKKREIKMQRKISVLQYNSDTISSCFCKKETANTYREESGGNTEQRQRPASWRLDSTSQLQ